jgi:hypothetical protein
MMFAVLVGATAWFGANEAEPIVVSATASGQVFEEWPVDSAGLLDEDQEPPQPNCTFWDAKVQFSSPLCSHFSLSRLAANHASRATERAVACAAMYDTDCLLSPEIGLSIPAAFLYDPTSNGMRMVIAPRVVTTVSQQDDERVIRVLDPSSASSISGRTMRFNNSVTAEFLSGGSRVPVTETFHGADAFCVQLLRSVFNEDCWVQLD